MYTTPAAHLLVLRCSFNYSLFNYWNNIWTQNLSYSSHMITKCSAQHSFLAFVFLCHPTLNIMQYSGCQVKLTDVTLADKDSYSMLVFDPPYRRSKNLDHLITSVEGRLGNSDTKTYFWCDLIILLTLILILINNFLGRNRKKTPCILSMEYWFS